MSESRGLTRKRPDRGSNGTVIGPTRQRLPHRDESAREFERRRGRAVRRTLGCGLGFASNRRDIGSCPEWLGRPARRLAGLASRRIGLDGQPIVFTCGFADGSAYFSPRSGRIGARGRLRALELHRLPHGSLDWGERTRIRAQHGLLLLAGSLVSVANLSAHCIIFATFSESRLNRLEFFPRQI